MMRIFLFLMSIVIAAGCTANPENDSPPPNNQQHKVRVKQTEPQKQDIKNHQEVAARLERLAEQLPQVNSANCVVIGNTAVLGINVDEELDRSRVGVIKYTVAEALRQDPHGAHAIVTADIDLAERIRGIRDEINKGKPLSGFTQELAAIIGRIMPQLPQDILQEDKHPEQPIQSDDSKKLSKDQL